MLEQLISNGLLYRREIEPKLIVQVDAEGPDVVLVVSDNGIGIPKESIVDVFCAFRRLTLYQSTQAQELV